MTSSNTKATDQDIKDYLSDIYIKGFLSPRNSQATNTVPGLLRGLSVPFSTLWQQAQSLACKEVCLSHSQLSGNKHSPWPVTRFVCSILNSLATNTVPGL